MNGSVVKKGNRWYVIIEQRDPQTGKRKPKWHSGFRTKREAEAARIDLLSRIQRGIYVTPSGETLSEFLAEWLPAKAPTVRTVRLARTHGSSRPTSILESAQSDSVTSSHHS